MSSTQPSFWNDSLSGHYLWSNTNFGEAVTETMTPLTWSVLRFTLADWTFIPGFRTVGNIGGSPYLNISIFASVFKAMGRSQADLLNTMEATLNMRLPEGMEIPLLPRRQWRLLPAVWAVLGTGWKQQMGRNQIKAYLRDNPDWFQQMRRRLQAETHPAALADLWQTDIRAHILQGVWCALGSGTGSADYTMPLRRELERLVGAEAAAVLISSLNQSSHTLPSLGPVLGLSQVARGELTRAAYLEMYGHRGPHEFELAKLRPAEDPAWLDEQLARYTRDPVDVQALLARQQAAYQAAWQRLEQRHPLRAGALQRRIAESTRRARLREETRSAYTRDRWLVRLFALRAAELTALGESVFYLTLDEVLQILRGAPIPADTIASRRSDYAAYLALPPYPPVIVGSFDPFAWAADPARSAEIFMAEGRVRAEAHPRSPQVITGTPGSAGVVEGRARVLHSLAEADALQPGEILVATFTDIGWTPLFPRAAAVVTDVGAMLSHAAIVARELGIPAVVGCGNATARLHTGDRLRVDGSQGVIYIL